MFWMKANMFMYLVEGNRKDGEIFQYLEVEEKINELVSLFQI